MASWGEVVETPHRRKFLLSLAIAGVSCLLIAAVFSSNFAEGSEIVLKEATSSEEDVGPSDKAYSQRASRGRRHAGMTVKEEEKEATDRMKEMLRVGPTVDRTDDNLVATRARVSALRASIADVSSEESDWVAQVKTDKAQVSKAEEARKQMTMRVVAAESTLKQARNLAADGRELEGLSKQARSESELDEAEGVAIQQPAEELLKDSKKLNDQSNLVLDQSKSPQAKALAALDLKMAQSLAQRAGRGMSSAKAYFARAIAARKEAVEDDVQAASDVRKAAKVSLAEQPGLPALQHVAHGEVRGPEALSEIITADSQAVDRAEMQLGNAEGQLAGDRSSLAWAAEQVQVLVSKSAALKKELAGAQKAVEDAQKAHDSAARELRIATSDGLAAEAEVDSLRTGEVKSARARLAAVEAKKHLADRKYRAALKKVADLNGHQTLLQVEVARLTLELKEAQMQRDDADAKEASAQQTINSLQVQLDKEGEELSQSRLHLADERLRLEPENGDAASDVGDGNGAAGSAAGAVAAADDSTGLDDDSDSASLSAGLERERSREQRLRQQQQAAERAAHDEELKLRRAQAAVSAQMAKVASLERNIR